MAKQNKKNPAIAMMEAERERTIKELKKKLLPRWLKPFIIEEEDPVTINIVCIVGILGIAGIVTGICMWSVIGILVAFVSYVICACIGALASGEAPVGLLFPLLTLLALPTFIVMNLFKGRSFNENIRKQYEQLLAESALAIPSADTYEKYIARMEAEVLGEKSPLRIIRDNLQKRIERVGVIGAKILNRISHTLDEERCERLREAYRQQQATQTRLNDTLKRHDNMIVCAQAAFEECREQTRRIQEQVEDDELIRELNKEAEAAEELEESSADAIYQTIGDIVGRLEELRSGLRVRIADDTGLFLNDKADLKQELARYEQIAEAAYGSMDPALAKAAKQS